MRYASIDIGTNTIRLLIVEKKGNCEFDILYQDSKIARLGENFLPDKILKNRAIDRAINILSNYKNHIEKYKCSRIFAVATSAVREAKNNFEFVSRAKNIGISIKVINELEEAHLTHKGILFFLDKKLTDKKWVAFDLGGGSTEFMFSKGNKLEYAFSIPLGVVKLVEKFIHSDPPILSEIDLAAEHFIKELKKHKNDFNLDLDIVVGNAGTVTTLAAIDLNLEKYSYKKTEGYMLSKDRICKTFHKLVEISSKDRLLKYPILQKGREDVIVIGTKIVCSLLDFFGKAELLVTNGSLREGLLLEKLCYE